MKDMKIQAAPYHRMLAGLLAVVATGCYLFVAFLYGHPLKAFALLIPLLILMAVVYIPYYRDHQGVTYEIASQEIILWRKNKAHRRIPLDDIVSVRDRSGAILLRRRGFWRASECLHPLAQSDDFAQTIKEKLQNKSMHGTREELARP